MNKKEFMGSLEKHLKYLPKEDREDALNYYSELIEDSGFSEEDDISAKLGDPKKIAKNIIAECTEKHIESHNEKKTPKSSASIVWMTILMICSLPVTLPLAIALLLVFIYLLFAVIVVIFACGVSFLAVAASGLAILFGGFFAAGIGQKLVLWGTGLVLTAVGILLFVGIVKLAELFVKLLILICKSIIKKNKEK